MHESLGRRGAAEHLLSSFLPSPQSRLTGRPPLGTLEKGASLP